MNHRVRSKKSYEEAQRRVLFEKRLLTDYRIDQGHNLLRELRMKPMAINTQYLKNPMSAGYINYEVLRQSIIIVLCAAYGASIFNGKNGPFG